MRQDQQPSNFRDETATLYILYIYEYGREQYNDTKMSVISQPVWGVDYRVKNML